MRITKGAMGAGLVLVLGQQAGGQERQAMVVTGLRSQTVLAATTANGRPASISGSEVRLPAKIVSIDARKVAEVVDTSGRHLWLPLRELVTNGASGEKVGPCTGDQTRGVRGVRPC